MRKNGARAILACISISGMIYCIYLISSLKIILPVEKIIIYTSLAGFGLQAILFAWKKIHSLILPYMFMCIHWIILIISYHRFIMDHYWYLLEYDRMYVYIALIIVYFCVVFLSTASILFYKTKILDRKSIMFSCSYLVILLMILGYFLISPKNVDPKIIDSYYQNDFCLASTSDQIIALEDGKPIIYGRNTSKEIEDWSNLIKVDACNNDVYGLSREGKVYYHGNNDKIEIEVNYWNKIKDIAVGEDFVVALGESILFAGNLPSHMDEIEELTLNLATIKQIEIVGSDLVLLNNDGTIQTIGNVMKHYNLEKWRNIRFISGGATHLIGITNDGTVLTAGEPFSGQCAVNKIRGAVYGYAGERNSIVILEKGQVIAVGNLKSELESLSKYKEIKAVTDGDLFIGVLTENGVKCDYLDML